MIIVRLAGGLGNQLFQYSAARALAIKTNASLMLDQGLLHVRSSAHISRDFELHHFRLSGNKLVGRTAWQPWQARLVSSGITLLSRMPDVLYRETRNRYHPLPDASSLIILEGYFQSHKYFEQYRSQLCQELQLRDPVPPGNAGILGLIKTTASASLHVRRGDYVSNQAAAHFHGLCSMEYYRAAISELEARFGSLEYFIFSDDLEWCKQHFGFLPNKHFVECNSATTAHLDLNLMRHCKYHIMANSSFSWWGAWLSDYADRTVIYPRQWFTELEVDGASRFPDEWQGL